MRYFIEARHSECFVTEGRAEGDGRRRKLENNHNWPLRIPLGLAFFKIGSCFYRCSSKQVFIFHTVPFRLRNAWMKGQAPKVTSQSVFAILAKLPLMYGAGEVELTLIISQNSGAAAALSSTV